MGRVSDPRFSEAVGATRRESIRTAIGIWARGALQNRGKLSAIAPSPERSAGKSASRGPSTARTRTKREH